MFRKLLLVLLVAMLSLTALVAQTITPTDDAEIDPNANITWPPPVYVLRGEVEIYGTANLPDMTNYFLEFRPIEALSAEAADAAEAEAAAEDEEDFELRWFPMTLPSGIPVIEDALGEWNTETTEDGLYEIRLTINIAGEDPVEFVVGPIRIENNPPDFIDDLIDTAPVVQATPTAAPVDRPTLAPSPTVLDTTPRVTARLNANVRAGDTTDYEVIGTLFEGTDARVIGRSSTGSGWYFIELPEGDRGFIAPSVVDASGDLRSVPRVDPPPPPFTPTPLPTITPVPSGNLAGSPPSLTPATPVCNQQFEVLVNITNNGTARTTGESTVVIQDVHVASGSVQATITRTVPALDPGSNFVIGGPLTISTFFNEEHRIVVTIDQGNVIAETNENDNILTTTYTLAQGACG